MISRVVFLIGLVFLALVIFGDSTYQTEWALLFGAFMAMAAAFQKDQTKKMRMFFLLPISILIVSFVFSFL